eukprot:CFRG6089T1
MDEESEVPPRRQSILRRKINSLWSGSSGSSKKSSSQYSSDALYVIKSLSRQLRAWREMDTLVLLETVEQLRGLTEIDRLDSKQRRGEAHIAVASLVEILMSECTESSLVTMKTCPRIETIVIQVLLCLRYITKGDAANIEEATIHRAAQVCKFTMVKFSNNPYIQRNCYMVFRSLTFNRADNQRYIVQQLDAVPLVCRAMTRFADSTSLQASAFMFIQNITWLVEENRQIVEQEGGISLILTTMKNKPDSLEVQKWGCGALQNLACNVNCTIKLIQAGVIQIALRAMTAFPHDSIVQNYGLGVMRNLSFMKEHRVEVARTGSIQLALDAMKAHPSSLEVQSSACSFIFNVIIEIESNKMMLLECSGVLDLFFEAITRHFSDFRFVDKCNVLLDQLATGNAHSCYIDPKFCFEPYSLTELAARQIADQYKNNAEMPTDSFPDIAEQMLTAKECPNCHQKYITNYDIATKPKPDCWTLQRVCSRRCVEQMTRACVETYDENNASLQVAQDGATAGLVA